MRELPPSPLRTLPAAALALRAAARAVAIVSAAFCLVVGLTMMFAQVRMVQNDVLNDPRLLELRRQFSTDPDNERLKREIRATDLQVRQTYLAYQEKARTGARLLLYGALALMASLAVLPLLREAMPDLDALGTPPSEWIRRRHAWQGLAFGAVAVVAIAALVAWVLRSAPERERAIAAGPSETLAAPSSPSPEPLPRSTSTPAVAHE